MRAKVYIGIDNGTTGTIGILGLPDQGNVFMVIPSIKQQDYVKKKSNVTRIDHMKLKSILRDVMDQTDECFCYFERPVKNPGRFSASFNAARALESVLIILEELSIPFLFIDSKEWQRKMLPSGIKGPELKKASKDIGIRLFPSFKEIIEKHGDADGILIAEYARKYS